jgi:transcriptional regulator with XRE-family HTH domain
MSTTDPGQMRPIHSPEELGSVISELRSLRRKTQFEVSAALSIDRSQLAHLEGGRSGRYLAHLLDILSHLGAELQIHWPTPHGSSSPAPTRAPKVTSQPREAKGIRAEREDKPEQEPVPEPAHEAAPEAEPEAKMAVAVEPSSAQLTKITNLAMNVMAASQQLTGKPTRPVPAAPTLPD